jgi:hypothetical protein
MLELKVKENIGYKITMQCTVVNGANEELIVVLGERDDGRCVTWITMDGERFDLGHYFYKEHKLEAMNDMFERAKSWNLGYARKFHKTPREMLEDEGYFGIVMWSNDELGAALNEAGYSPTERNIEFLRVESEQSLYDDMIERGWETIDSMIGILENEYELDKDEEE